VGGRWLTEAQVEAYQRRRAEQLSQPTLVALGCVAPVKRATRSELEAELQRQIEEAQLPGSPKYDMPYLIGSRCRADVLFERKRLVIEIQGV
jgi:very-short-patch-repair endonuclease